MARKERRLINRNYAEFNFRIMQLLGIWNPYTHGIPFWLYQFYTIVVFTIIVIVYTFLEILDAIVVKDNLQLFTENICFTLTHLAGIVKIINLWTRKAKIYTIVDILERVLRQENDEVIGRVQEKLIEGAVWQGKMVTKTFGVLICCTALAGMGFPFWDQSYKQWKFPYRCYFPMNTNHSTPYWSSFTFIGVSVTWQALIILSHDALFVVFMIHVVAQITTLKIKVETVCNEYSSRKYPEKFGNEIKKREVASYETLSTSTIVASRLEGNNERITNLKACIGYHQEIIRLVYELESMFSNVILLQFATSLVIIGLTGFQVIVSTRSGRFLPMAGYLCCILLELLLYCWYGNEIIIQSDSLKNSAYACSWYKEERKFCEILKIFMARTQKPLVVTAGNFCDLSLETFGSVSALVNACLNKTYSLQGYLRNSNSSTNLTGSQESIENKQEKKSDSQQKLLIHGCPQSNQRVNYKASNIASLRNHTPVEIRIKWIRVKTMSRLYYASALSHDRLSNKIDYQTCTLEFYYVPGLEHCRIFNTNQIDK